MADRQLIQKVFDFQLNCSHVILNHDPFYQNDKEDNEKFRQWNLETTIKSLSINENNYKIKWAGNERSCFIDAFIYCLFKGSKSKLANKNGIFIKLKCVIYDLATKFLSLIEQKLISQMVCGAQYTEDLSIYFNKKKVEVKLFKKLLKHFTQSNQLQHEQGQSQQHVQVFTKIFQFVTFMKIQQNVWQFYHYSQKFYIIIQKGCYFIVEVLQQDVLYIKSRKISQNSIVDHSRINEKAKKLEYSTPQFILNNKMNEKKKNLQQSTFSVNKRCSLQSYPRLHTYDWIIQENKPKSIRKQGQILKKQKQFYTKPNERGKTDIMSPTNGAYKVGNNRPNNNPDDQKQFHRANLKRIELNLKSLKLKNRINTNSQNCSQNELLGNNNIESCFENEFSFNNGSKMLI